MNTPPKVYLETSVFSYYHEERTDARYQELREDVHKVFDLVKAGHLTGYTSFVTLLEIEDETNTEKRAKMLNLITDFGFTVLPSGEESQRLTDLYIQEKVVSPANSRDASHIAITTVNGLDFIASLNFTHIVRPWTIERVRQVNERENYRGIGIYKPSEVLEIYENSRRLS